MIELQYEEYLALREGAEVLLEDSGLEKVLRLPDGTFLKFFRRKRVISSAAWYPYAQRFVDNAEELARRGIPCPKVIRIFRVRKAALDVVHYYPLEGSTLRELRSRGLDPETEESLKQAFLHFVVRLHDLGIYFRSLHLGNVVLTPEGELGLIDISDLKMYRRPLGRLQRIRNLRRIQGKRCDRDWLNPQQILDLYRHKNRT